MRLNIKRIVNRAPWYVLGVACVAFILGCVDGPEVDSYGRVVGGGAVPTVTTFYYLVFLAHGLTWLWAGFLAVHKFLHVKIAPKTKAIQIVMVMLLFPITLALSLAMSSDMCNPAEEDLGGSYYPVWHLEEAQRVPWYMTELHVMSVETEVLDELAELPVLHTIHFRRPISPATEDWLSANMPDVQVVESRCGIGVWFNVAEYYESRGKQVWANEIYDTIIWGQNNDQNDWLEIAEFHAQRGEYERAKKAAVLVGNSIEHEQSVDRLLDVVRKTEDLDSALQLMESLTTPFADAKVHEVQGRCCERASEYETAIKHYEKSIVEALRDIEVEPVDIYAEPELSDPSVNIKEVEAFKRNYVAIARCADIREDNEKVFAATDIALAFYESCAQDNVVLAKGQVRSRIYLSRANRAKAYLRTGEYLLAELELEAAARNLGEYDDHEKRWIQSKLYEIEGLRHR